MSQPVIRQTAAELAVRLRDLDREDRTACLLTLIRDLEDVDQSNQPEEFLDSLAAALEVRLREGTW